MWRIISILCLANLCICIAYADQQETGIVSNIPTNQVIINSSSSGKSLSANSRNFNAKIAVVDIESVFAHSIAIKDIKTKINNLSDEIQNEMSSIEVELKESEAYLMSHRNDFSEEEFNLRTSEFNKKVSHAQKLLQSRKSAIEQARSDAIAVVQQTIISIISDLSKKHDFNLVMPVTQVIFVDEKLNITLDVITHLNKNMTSVEVKYSPIS